MPKPLNAGCEPLRTNFASPPSSPETHPLVISKLESINPSAQTLRYYLPWISDSTCQRLSEYFSSNKGEYQAVAQKISESRSLEKEMEEARLEEAKGNSPSRYSRAGMIIAALSAATAAGMAGYSLLRRGDNALSLANTTDISAGNYAQQLLLEPAALTDNRRHGASTHPIVDTLPLLNAMRDNLLKNYPGIDSQAVANLMVTPLLNILVESLHGQSLTQDQLPRLQYELSIMINILFSTLTMPEHIRLYQHTRGITDSSEFTRRFAARDGQPWVRVDQKPFRLSTSLNGAPLVIDVEGRCRFIRFNQKQSHWEFVDAVDNEGYNYKNKEYVDSFALSLANVPEKMTLEYNDKQDMVKVMGYESHFTRGIFSWGRFIPDRAKSVQKSEDNKKKAAILSPATCNKVTNSWLLSAHDYGWYHERPSAKMDDYLQLLLESPAKCNKITASRPLKLINPANGLSKDTKGKTFLKRNRNYYHAELAYDAAKDKQYLTLTDYPKNVLTYQNGVMLLTSAENIIFALHTDLIRYNIMPPQFFHIESEVVEYLKEHAVITTDVPKEALSSHHPGLWKDAENKLMFIINDDKYAVRDYASTDIHLINRHDPAQREQDIVLWAVGDTLLRVRDGKPLTSYTKLPVNKKHPSVSIETDLNKQLQKYIDTHHMNPLHPDHDSLVKNSDFALPLAWRDTTNQQNLFMFNGMYFPAKIINNKAPDNPTGHYSIAISDKEDLFSKNTPLATLILENKEGTIEIKKWRDYLAEKLQIDKKVADRYLQNYPWRNIPGIRPVEESVNAVLASGKWYVHPIDTASEQTFSALSLSSQKYHVKKNLYPEHVRDHQLKISKLSQNEQILTAREIALKNSVTNITQLINENIFPLLEKALYFNSPQWPLVKSYIQQALNIDSEEFESAFAVSWRQQLDKIKKNLKEENVHVVHGKDISLTAEQQASDSRIYMSPVDGNIYVNSHKITTDNEDARLTADIIQAVASTSGMSCDFTRIDQIKSMQTPIRDAGDIIAERLKQRRVTAIQQQNLYDVSKKYLSNVPAYQKNTDTLLSPAKLGYLAKFDPAFRGHLFLNTAPLITQLSLDMFYQLVSTRNNSAAVDDWKEKYCQLRNFCIDPPARRTTTTPSGAGINAISPHRSANATTTGKNVTLSVRNILFNKGDIKYFRHPQVSGKNTPGGYVPEAGDKVFRSGPDYNPTDLSQQSHIIISDRWHHPTNIRFKGKNYSADSDQQERTWVPGHGNVLTIEIKELACLGEKDLTAAQILRMYGEALQNPVVAFALAQQEDYHLEIAGGECPSEEDVRWLAERASVFDAMIDTFLMFTPQLWPVYALKTLLGPTLVLIADGMEGKEIHARDVIALVLNGIMQGFSTFRTEIPTLRGVDRARLLTKAPIATPGRGPAAPAFKPRFNFKHSGIPYIKVAEKEYPLQITDEATSVIQDDKGRYREVKYNQQEEHWEIFDNYDRNLAAKNRRTQNKFKYSLAYIPDGATVEQGIQDSIVIKIPGERDIVGVFIGMDFIPAKLETIDNKIIAWTSSNTVPEEERRLLTYDEYGWDFERPSVKMDENLATLLATKDTASTDSSQIEVGAIRDADGLSYGEYGEAYIKKEHLYYRVDIKGAKGTHQEMTLPDYDDAKIEYADGYFSLVSSNDIIFPLRTVKTQTPDPTSRIEVAALENLRQYATKLTSDHIGPESRQSGSVFSVGNEHFLVNSHTDKTMTLPMKPPYGNSAIKLWSDNNAWFRVREESEDGGFDYKDITLCRPTRSPGAGSSCPASKVSVETELYNRLWQAIRGEMTSDRASAPEKLTVIRKTDIPFLFLDKQTNNHYFQFAGSFFNAEIIEKTNKIDNPTGYPCIKITGRSDFFNREKEIATIVMMEDGDSIKAADMPTFLAEKLNLNTQQTAIFLKNRAFIDMEHADELDVLTNRVRISETSYVEPYDEVIPEHRSQLSEIALLNAAKEAFFPENIRKSADYNIFLDDLKFAPEKDNAHVQRAKIYISNQLDFLQKTMLVSVIKSFNAHDYNNPVVEDYLSEIFDNNESDFLSDVQTSLYSRLLSAKDDLAARKIRLMSAVRKTPKASPEYVQDSNKVVFIDSDDSSNIFINIDALDMEPGTKETPVPELTGALLDAILLSTGKTLHLFDIPLKQGIHLNIKDAYNHLQRAVQSAHLDPTQTSQLQSVISRYLTKCPIYDAHKEILSNIASDGKKFSYLFQNDPGFRAHITLNSDELVSSITQDLHYRISVYHQDEFILHPWVKNYGDRRGVSTFTSGAERYSDAYTPPGNELSYLENIDLHDVDLSASPGQRNIYSAADSSLYMWWQNKYYPANFIGTSGRVLELGSPSEIRQVYYYNPGTGDIEAIWPSTPYSSMIKYFSELDLYERSSVEAGLAEVLRFDVEQDKLVPTGATRLIHMPGHVLRIECPDFTIYHPHGASGEIYLQGHGKVLPTQTTVPYDMNVYYYTSKGHQLVPYRGSAVDLLSNRFDPKEYRAPGDPIDNYSMASFTGFPVNHYHLARKYNKNMIYMTSSTVDSGEMMKIISNVFPDEKIDLHLYICRKADRTQKPEGSVPQASSTSGITRFYPPDVAVTTWEFDKTARAESSESQQGFAPLKDINLSNRPATVDVFIYHYLNGIFGVHPYEVFYGFDTSEIAAKQIPLYIFNSRIQLRKAMERVKITLSNALENLNDPNRAHPINDYLSTAFDVTDPAIIEHIKNRMKIYVTRINGYILESAGIDYKNIAIASTIRVEEPKGSRIYQSKLPNTASSTMAFVVSGDAMRRMFIIDDFFPKVKAKTADPAAVERTQQHYIIHESSHVAAETVDIMYTLDMNLRETDVQGGLRNLNDILKSGKIKETEIWRSTMPAVYRHLKMTPRNEAETIKLINETPLIKANIIIDNADSVTRFILDLANIKAETPVKREAEEVNEDLVHLLMRSHVFATIEHYS